MKRLLLLVTVAIMLAMTLGTAVEAMAAAKKRVQTRSVGALTALTETIRSQVTITLTRFVAVLAMT